MVANSCHPRTLAIVALLGWFLSFQPANAELIGTEQATRQVDTQQERERIKAFLERQDASRQLQTLGIPAQTALRRVDAMTDEEVSTIAGKLDTLPAGGDFSAFQVIVIALPVALIVVVL